MEEKNFDIPGVRLETITAGPMQNDTYIVLDEKSNEAVVIDPGQHNTRLLELLRHAPYRVKYIVGTHGHFDHMLSAADVQELTGAGILIHEGDEACLHDDRENLFAQWSPRRSKPAHAERLLHDGDTFSVGDTEFTVLHTPGHSPGSICLACGRWLFTGDTLFAGSVGRSDLLHGSYPDLMRSLARLRALPGDWRVLPGHEGETTLEHKRRTNAFFTGGDVD